jgi:hypothetical protein
MAREASDAARTTRSSLRQLEASRAQEEQARRAAVSYAARLDETGGATVMRCSHHQQQQQEEEEEFVEPEAIQQQWTHVAARHSRVDPARSVMPCAETQLRPSRRCQSPPASTRLDAPAHLGPPQHSTTSSRSHHRCSVAMGSLAASTNLPQAVSQGPVSARANARSPTSSASSPMSVCSPAPVDPCAAALADGVSPDPLRPRGAVLLRSNRDSPVASTSTSASSLVSYSSHESRGSRGRR